MWRSCFLRELCQASFPGQLLTLGRIMFTMTAILMCIEGCRAGKGPCKRERPQRVVSVESVDGLGVDTGDQRRKGCDMRFETLPGGSSKKQKCIAGERARRKHLPSPGLNNSRGWILHDYEVPSCIRVVESGGRPVCMSDAAMWRGSSHRRVTSEMLITV